MIHVEELEFSTQGFSDIVDITDQIARAVRKSKITRGLVTVSIPGSTASITTMEFEPGLIEDIKTVLEKLIPSSGAYAHNQTWGDGNGFSHVRAALMGPSRSIPVNDGKILLGTWQQVVLIDFDNRPRKRTVIVQVMGEDGR